MAETYFDDEKAIVFANYGNDPLVDFLTKFCQHKDVRQEDIEHVISICGNRVVYLKTTELCEKIFSTVRMLRSSEEVFRFVTKLVLPVVAAKVEKSDLQKALEIHGKVIEMIPRRLPDISRLPDVKYNRWFIHMYLQKEKFPTFLEKLHVETPQQTENIRVVVECSRCRRGGHNFLICPNANERDENRQTEYQGSIKPPERNKDPSKEMLTEKGREPFLKKRDASSRLDDPGPSGSQGIKRRCSSPDGITRSQNILQISKERNYANNNPSTTGMKEMSEATTDNMAPPGNRRRNPLSTDEYLKWVRFICYIIYAKGILTPDRLYKFLSNVRNSKKFFQLVKNEVGKNIPSLIMQLESQKELIELNFPEIVKTRPLKNIVSMISSWIAKLRERKRAVKDSKVVLRIEVKRATS